MKTITFHAAIVALAVLGATACGRVVPLTASTPVLLQTQANPADLRAALIRAFEARRYTMESEQPGVLVARYQRRGQTLRIQVDYSATDYRITYLDSTGLSYRLGDDGNPVISRNYDRYVAQLQRTIGEEIARPGREAQEAAEEERNRVHEAAEDQRNRERQAVEDQRNQERDAREYEARERQRDRQAQTDQQRLRTEQAQAEADARRPVIADHRAYVVESMVVRRGRGPRARFGTVRIGRRHRSRWVEGQAEGDTSSSSLGLPESCRGFYAGAPEHLLRVGRRVEYLRLETESDGDPTLMLVAADGAVYCDDDGGSGLNSRIQGSFPPGDYRVYVGSYQPGTSARYRLEISTERAVNRAPPVARRPVQPQPAPVADCRSLVVQMGHSPMSTMHCRGAEPRCAEALLRAGHSPVQLLHCGGVEPQCAVTLLQAGNGPVSLVNCRR